MRKNCEVIEPKIEFSNSTDEKPAENNEKSVSLLLALGISIGNIIGSGIFRTVDSTFNVWDSEAIGMVIIFWVGGGMAALLGGLCYAELGTYYPESGGERAYFKNILNTQISTVFVIFLFATRSIAIAGMALTGGEYFMDMFKVPVTSRGLIILAAIISSFMCFFINLWSKTITAKASFVFTILKSIGIIMILGFGISRSSSVNTTQTSSPFDLRNFSTLRLADCISNVVWAYEGWNSLGLIAGEMINPSRDLPVAITIGVLIVTFFYTGSIISYNAVLGYSVARNTSTIAVSAARVVIGRASPIICLVVWFSILGSLCGNFFMSALTASSAGTTGQLPKIFSLVHKTSRTPVFPLAFIFLISFILTFFSLNKLLLYSSFINWIFYFLAFLCLFKIKLKTKPTTMMGKINFCTLVPLKILCVFIIILSFSNEPIGCTFFLALLLASYGLQYLPEKYKQKVDFSDKFNKFPQFLIDKLPVEYANENDIK